MSHKRAAESQLTRDDDGDERADDEFVTTPQIADATEMSMRRVVRVRRPEGGSSSTTTTASSGGSSGFFKDAAVAAGSAAPTKPTFGFNFGTSASGSGGSTATTATPATFSFGAAPAEGAPKPATGFGFGFPSTTTASGAKPAFSFSAAPAPSTSTSASEAKEDGEKATAAPTTATAATPIAFTFGSAPPTSDDAAKKPAATFSFGFPTTAAPATADGASSAEKKPLFGAGTFNFGNAVNSFVAARTKMQEEAKEGKQENKAEATAADAKDADNDNNDDDDDTPDPAGFGSEIVEPTARDVLATAPSKLYLFEKGEDGKAGRWAERGSGDAKLVSQPKAGNAAEHLYRLLVRGGYSLNATIKKNTFTLSKTEAKHLILLVATAEGPQTYLLKFTGPSAEANTTTFSAALKKVVEEVSKAE